MIKEPKFPSSDLDCMFLMALMMICHRNNPAKLRQVSKQQIKNVPRKVRPAFALVGLSKNPVAVIQNAIDDL